MLILFIGLVALLAVVAMCNMDSIKKAFLFLVLLFICGLTIYLFIHYPGWSAIVITLMIIGGIRFGRVR
ncbi:hypothetical protein [Sphingobacterium paludis]|uniref:Uncharacterized protein n=1 Tax=Sphingobacterium paludis TaxID=1476465 RepID=A0A4R7D7V9_9SPHI|nr:hypothetical protein [Sphingobacterium paludis]TDS17299.1 hypothetical protein B0I21_101163 [Sphingobacterium paludis]